MRVPRPADNAAVRAERAYLRAEMRFYYVYVVEIAENTVYVGQTAQQPSDRLAQHKRGPYSARRVREAESARLRPDLYSGRNPLTSRGDAEKAEKALARELKGRGYRVLCGNCLGG